MARQKDRRVQPGHIAPTRQQTERKLDAVCELMRIEEETRAEGTKKVTFTDWAWQYGLDYGRLVNRYHGRQFKCERKGPGARLSPGEEELLLKWIRQHELMSMPLNHSTVNSTAQQIVQRDSEEGVVVKPLSRMWTKRFLHKHGITSVHGGSTTALHHAQTSGAACEITLYDTPELSTSTDKQPFTPSNDTTLTVWERSVLEA